MAKRPVLIWAGLLWAGVGLAGCQHCWSEWCGDKAWPSSSGRTPAPGIPGGSVQASGWNDSRRAVTGQAAGVGGQEVAHPGPTTGWPAGVDPAAAGRPAQGGTPANPFAPTTTGWDRQTPSAGNPVGGGLGPRPADLPQGPAVGIEPARTPLPGGAPLPSARPAASSLAPVPPPPPDTMAGKPWPPEPPMPGDPQPPPGATAPSRIETRYPLDPPPAPPGVPTMPPPGLERPE
jgi:hypothetical protein